MGLILAVTSLFCHEYCSSTCSDLDSAMKSLFTKDTLLLGPGTWTLSSAAILELGGTLQGVDSSEDSRPVLQDQGYERASWLQFSYNEATLSNLCLNVKHKYE
ncbi:uncharacterized protein LOC103507963 [Diaphorina citri]|uniref:Uncharacterized protein LOC103507963 n=1 Tax=Diaphorina citri TaxID=121845 RepID=A0A3Q0IQF7_DIACI|nr:uncharacterized protein LOC103507963 [Diaphorina citri]